MDDLYQEHILDHYKNPRNVGSISTSSKGEKLVHTHAANAGCGDSIEADVRVKDGIITEIKWRGTGCAISQAAMSTFSEWMTGKSLVEGKSANKKRILSLVGLSDITPAREKCLVLPLGLFLEVV